jgi:hypothetical protein
MAVLVALVQLLGPAAAGLADAQLETAANTPNAASHIESHGRPECARVHADDCALCQYLTTASDRPPATATAPVAMQAARPAVAVRLGSAAGRLDARPRSRAPPILV